MRKLEEKVFDDFDNSLERILVYIQNCQKASKELRTMNALTGIPEDFVSVSGDISDEAIKRVFQAIINEEPKKISHVTNRKTCIFV